MTDLATKYKYFKEWLDNGGNDNPLPPNLRSSIENLRFSEAGDIIPESVDSVVNAAMLAIIASHLSNPYQFPKKISEYQSLLQKEVYFEQYTINSIEEFDKFYVEYGIAKKTIFRGVTEAKWRLYNSLQRYWITSEKQNDIELYKRFVKSMTDQARIENNNLLKKFLIKNDINPDNDVTILSFLQHYGCPTPMLDWTYSLDCALFFATEKIVATGKREIDEYLSIYFLEEEHIKETSIRIIAERFLKNYEKKVKSQTAINAKKEGITQEEIDKLFSPYRVELTTKMMYGKLAITGACQIDSIFIQPMSYFSDVDDETPDLIPFSLNNNLNVVNQDGVFIFNNNPILSLEEVGMDSHKNNTGETYNYRFCKCYNINKKLAPYILDKLASNLVSRDSIYPDPIKLVGKVFNEVEKNIR